jgi:DNA processing protein
MAQALSDSERRAWLRLARTQNVGPVTFAGLIARFGSASASLSEIPRLAKRGGAAVLRVPSDADARQELESLAKLGGRMIARCEPDYPSGLAALEAPPPLIEVIGQSALLTREMIAVVGARNASALGRKLAGILAKDLSSANLVVVSGMARGIDAAAHEASLEGGTVAVLAGGADIVYPPENEPLYRRICEQGIIISEMMLGQPPQARHFPRRNRIISGLCRGVVVVEASEGSGSLITANYALEQGREIFAVPGSPLDPRTKGANRLIREGGTLTESAEDVLVVLNPILGRQFEETPAAVGLLPGLENNDSSIEREAGRFKARLEEALGPSPVGIDELVRQTGASAAAVQTLLLEMELAGRVSRHGGNKVSWR